MRKSDRRLVRTTLLLVCVVSVGGCTVPPSNPAPSTLSTFPNVEGSNLNDREYSLPADFEGTWNLVLLGYLKEHQAQVDTWLAIGPTLEERFESLRYYELPTLEVLTPQRRTRLDNRMKAEITRSDTRDRTITLYLDRTAFLESLGLSSTNEIHAILVDRDGRVVWIHEGPRTDPAERTLTRTLERLAASI